MLREVIGERAQDRVGLAVGNPDLFMQLTQCGEQAWMLEIQNPTDVPVTPRACANSAFDPLKGKVLPAGAVTIPAGASVVRHVE